MKKDFFLYNGPLGLPWDLQFMKFLEKNQKNDALTLVLVTPGGDPDAAYKIGKFIQSKYNSFSCLISGLCKSAGTLLATGSSEIIFAPYGELGPLDIQISVRKSDGVVGQDSGLNISEAFRTIEARAAETFHRLVEQIIRRNGGAMSIQTASRCASEIVTSLYSPILGKIDPEEVGQRARAMRIGEDYGLRLNQKFENTNLSAFSRLAQTYSSHSFVIDFDEAANLFRHVRMTDEIEKRLVEELKESGRFPQPDPVFKNLKDIFAECMQKTEKNQEENNNEADES